MVKTIIKGAIYFDGDILLRPHYSGSFAIVDCTEYKQKKEVKEDYGNNAKKYLSGFYLTYEGVKYYECEYSPHSTDSFELLSDIDKIEFYDEETEF